MSAIRNVMEKIAIPEHFIWRCANILLSPSEMFCGKWGAAQCSGERLFDYLGDYEHNEHTPLTINYHYVSPGDALPKGITALDEQTQECSADMQVTIVDDFLTISLILFADFIRFH